MSSSAPSSGSSGKPAVRYTIYASESLQRQRRRRALRWAVPGLVIVVLLGILGAGRLREHRGAAGERGGSQAGTVSTAAPPATGPVPRDTAPRGAAGREADTGGGAGRPAAYAPINTSYPGLSMFRGNAHRAYYGEGPVPKAPEVLWRFPVEGPMSSRSSEGGESRVWAGTGWTGQPVVVERAGRVEVMFGAYDRAVHFLDGATGRRILPDLPTGDLIKGSVMLDPDGYPLLYTGSRDNYFRVVALDRAEPTVLWKMNANEVPHPVWNNDWDSSALVVGDYLFEGGENSYLFIIKLNRSFDSRGQVRVAPKVLLAYPAYDDALFRAIGDRTVSIENSPAVHLDPERGDRVYFANSGGRVLGLDISALGLGRAGYGPGGQAPGTWEKGVGAPSGPVVRAVPELPDPRGAEFPVVFKFWTGDDVDASIVIDDEGMLYVAAELERMLPRAKEVGQLMKLDPYRPDAPLVWSIADPAQGDKGGIWATPALHGGMLYVPTHTGRLLGVDRAGGRIVWEKPFTYHAWGSPLVVDDTLIVGDTDGWIHAFDVSDPSVDPPLLWKVRVPGGGAVESTPALWRGRLYVGSRNGYFYCFGDR